MMQLSKLLLTAISNMQPIRFAFHSQHPDVYQVKTETCEKQIDVLRLKSSPPSLCALDLALTCAGCVKKASTAACGTQTYPRVMRLGTYDRTERDPMRVSQTDNIRTSPCPAGHSTYSKKGESPFACSLASYCLRSPHWHLIEV